MLYGLTIEDIGVDSNPLPSKGSGRKSLSKLRSSLGGKSSASKSPGKIRETRAKLALMYTNIIKMSTENVRF